MTRTMAPLLRWMRGGGDRLLQLLRQSVVTTQAGSFICLMTLLKVHTKAAIRTLLGGLKIRLIFSEERRDRNGKVLGLISAAASNK